MSITFNSSGGFLNGTISSSDNNLFIRTSGSVGAVNLGTQLQLTGSAVIEKDASGKVRNKKTFNADGSITQEKFDASERIVDTKVKDPTSGKEFRRSGSATANQIEFQQNAQGAFITVSGSVPGFNIIKSSETNQFRLIRQTSDVIYAGGSAVFNVGIDGSPESWYVNYGIGGGATATSLLQVSRSGDVIIKRDLIVGGKLTAQEIHTEFTSASIMYESGSTQFGDSVDDTHTFTGNITASGNISGSVTTDLQYGGATIHTVHTIANGTTTPSASGKTILKTGNSGDTNITGIPDGVAGQIVHFLIQDNNTDFIDGTNFQLFRGLDHETAQTNDTISFVCVDGTKWVELNRSDNT